MQIDQVAIQLTQGQIDLQTQFIQLINPNLLDQYQPTTKFLVFSHLRKHPNIQYIPYFTNIINRYQIALNAADPNPFQFIGNQSIYKMMCYAFANHCISFNHSLNDTSLDDITSEYILDELSSIKQYSKRKLASQILSKALQSNNIHLITKSLTSIEDDNSVIPDMQYRRPLLDLVPLLFSNHTFGNYKCIHQIVKMRRSCISYQDRRDLIKCVFSNIKLAENVNLIQSPPNTPLNSPNSPLLDPQAYIDYTPLDNIESTALLIINTVLDLHMGMEFEDLLEIKQFSSIFYQIPLNPSILPLYVPIYKHFTVDLHILDNNTSSMSAPNNILTQLISTPIYLYPFDIASDCLDLISKCIRESYSVYIPHVLALNNVHLLSIGQSIFKCKINIYENELNDQYDAQLFIKMIHMNTVDTAQLGASNNSEFASLRDHFDINEYLVLLFTYYTSFIKNITENYVWDSFCFNQAFFTIIQCESRQSLFHLLLSKVYDILQAHPTQSHIIQMCMEIFQFYSNSITCMRFALTSPLLVNLDYNRPLLFEYYYPKYRVVYYEFISHVAFNKDGEMIYKLMDYLQSQCNQALNNNSNNDTLNLNNLNDSLNSVSGNGNAIGLIRSIQGILQGCHSEFGLKSLIQLLLNDLIPLIHSLFGKYQHDIQFLKSVMKMSCALHNNELLKSIQHEYMVFPLFRELGGLMCKCVEATMTQNSQTMGNNSNESLSPVKSLTYLLKFKCQFLNDGLFYSAMIYYQDDVLMKSLTLILNGLMHLNEMDMRWPKFLTHYSKWFRRVLSTNTLQQTTKQLNGNASMANNSPNMPNGFSNDFSQLSCRIITIMLDMDMEDVKNGGIECIREWTKLNCHTTHHLYSSNKLDIQMDIIGEWIWILMMDYMRGNENEMISISCCIHNMVLMGGMDYLNIAVIEKHTRNSNSNNNIGSEIGSFLLNEMAILNTIDKVYSWVNIECVASHLKQIKQNIEQRGIVLQ
eukprot:NODE_12_length_54577_cov_0.384100.p2 type:complete len:979 gc:universal NODE_12_length_54577_cov_0.384100:34805-31869(-)